MSASGSTSDNSNSGALARYADRSLRSVSRNRGPSHARADAGGVVDDHPFTVLALQDWLFAIFAGGPCRQNSFLSQDLWSGPQAGSRRPNICGRRDGLSRCRTYWPIMPRRLPGARGAEVFSIILLRPVSWFWWGIAPQVRLLPIWRPGCPRAASSSWTARSRHREAPPHPSGPPFAISSEVLPRSTDLFRSGQNGSPAMRNALLSLASISWPAIPWPSLS